MVIDGLRKVKIDRMLRLKTSRIRSLNPLPGDARSLMARMAFGHAVGGRMVGPRTGNAGGIGTLFRDWIGASRGGGLQTPGERTAAEHHPHQRRT